MSKLRDALAKITGAPRGAADDASPQKHVCDPAGFACDCARRAEINARGRRPWLPRRPGWLRSTRSSE